MRTATDLRRSLRRQLDACDYPGYVYGYPHKKAYRPLPPLPLADVWRGEPLERLFCYVHVPFCNQRCSFCNLFTYVPAGTSPAAAYVDALGREARAYARALPDARFARLYLGGGTPTFLTADELRSLARALRDGLGLDPARAQGCVEASPETLDAEKVDALRDLGFSRLSLGVQSLDPRELHHVNRRFDPKAHDDAARLVARAGFRRFNVDLIYGLPGQTAASWLSSLRWAIDSPATSLFLYPLYVRPLTGLAARSLGPASPTGPQMASLYDLAVDRLAAAGFRQVTMRQFRRDAGDDEEDEYACQTDGMVGLGAGARSYTAGLHYSTPWRMVARNIRSVTDDYVRRSAEGDHRASFGFALDDDERRRRFVIQSLLYDGLDAEHRDPFAEEFDALFDEGLVNGGPRLTLTPRGVRHADVVGQLFFSARVRGLIDAYEYDE